MVHVGELPDIGWISTASQLFVKYGPYLVAILFLAVALSLIPFKNLIARILCIASFVVSVGVATFAIVVWNKSNPLGSDPNVRYVLIYRILDHGQFLQKISDIKPEDGLPAIAYSAPRWSNDEFHLILVSQKPISPEMALSIFFYTKDGAKDVPSAIFCRPPTTEEQIDIAQDQANVKEFHFRVMQHGQWQLLGCNG